MADRSNGPDTNVVFVPPLEGPRLWVANELITFVVTAEQTGGVYSLTDSVVPPAGSAPPHLHEREDEAFWVLEGELEVSVGEQTFQARTGSFVHLPRGVLHAYRNAGAAPARFLTLSVPGGVERFFQEVGKPVTDASNPPALEDEDVQRLVDAATRYGVRISAPASD